MPTNQTHVDPSRAALRWTLAAMLAIFGAVLAVLVLLVLALLQRSEPPQIVDFPLTIAKATQDVQLGLRQPPVTLEPMEHVPFYGGKTARM